MVEEFTEEERKILAPYFTNLDKPIFCLVNLPEVVKGALFSRYSRTTKSLRRVLLEEFILKPEMGFSEIVGHATEGGAGQIVAIKKAEEFYDRVLVGYGDDSVAELGGASIAVEDVSNIATKVLQDSRIGLSPLEKSTRYVRFDDKVNGEYRFYREPVIMESRHAEEYLSTCNLLFDTYSRMMEAVLKWAMEQTPKEEGVSDRAFLSACRAKALDVTRGLLPAATLTNTGIFGNGRAFEYLLTKMYADPLTEMRDVARSMNEELAKVIPSFVKRANDRYGKEAQNFVAETRADMQAVADRFLENQQPETAELVTLVKYDPEAELKVLSAMLYKHTKLPLKQLQKIIIRMTPDERKEILRASMAKRTNRRQRPGRAAENAQYTFDILANFGAYRDLHRHRMLTQERQDLTTRHGYDTPKEIIALGLKGDWDHCMSVAKDSSERIAAQYPKEAQYVVPMAYRVRWYMTMSMREVFHLTELRSMQQGHPDYRRVAQLIAQKCGEVHPALFEHMKFVDMKEYELERIESEKKLDRKMEELRKKHGG